LEEGMAHPLLNGLYFGNTGAAYLTAAGWIVLGLLAVKITEVVVLSRLRALAGKTTILLDDFLVESVERDGQEVETEDEYESEELHAFLCFLAGLRELGYGVAYRVLDAQYAGLAQRRKRVFVVGHLGDWRRAAAVLFERESLSGHPAPRREAGKGAAPTLAARTRGGGGLGTDFDLDGGLVSHALNASRGRACAHDASLETYVPVAHTLNAKGGAGRSDFESETLIAHTLCGGGSSSVFNNALKL